MTINTIKSHVPIRVLSYGKHTDKASQFTVLDSEHKERTIWFPHVVIVSIKTHELLIKADFAKQKGLIP